VALEARIDRLQSTVIARIEANELRVRTLERLLSNQLLEAAKVIPYDFSLLPTPEGRK
jgi:hypothetical protein